MIYQALLWRLINRRQLARVAFFGASITQQKESVSYASAVELASKYNNSQERLKLKVSKYGFGGMHITDAGSYYLKMIIESAPDICILEWHSTVLSDWPDGLLERICYTLLTKRIIPIVLVIPRALDEYFCKKNATSRFKAVKKLEQTMGISRIDLSESLSVALVDMLTRDGVHTNEDGACFYGCRVYRDLVRIKQEHRAFLPLEKRSYTSSSDILSEYKDINLLLVEEVEIRQELEPLSKILYEGPKHARCILDIRVGPFSPKILVSDAD